MNGNGSNPLETAGVDLSKRVVQVVVSGAFLDNYPQYLREDPRIEFWEIHDGRIEKKAALPLSTRFVFVMRAIMGSALGRKTLHLCKEARVAYDVGSPGVVRKMLKEFFPNPKQARASTAASDSSVPLEEVRAQLEAEGEEPPAEADESPAAETPAPKSHPLKTVSSDELVNLVSDHADFSTEPRTREITEVFSQLRILGYDVTEKQVTAAYYKALNILEGLAARRRRMRETSDRVSRTPIRQEESAKIPEASGLAAVIEPAAPAAVGVPQVSVSEATSVTEVPAAAPAPAEAPPPALEEPTEEQRRTKRGELQDLILELVDFFEPAKDIALVVAAARERGIPTTEESATNAYYKLRRQVLSGQKVRPIPLARQIRSRAEELLSIANLLVEAVRQEKRSSDDLSLAKKALKEATSRVEELQEELEELREENARLQSKLEQEVEARKAADARLAAIKAALGSK